MRFLSVPIEHSRGRILAHNVSGRDGTRLLRKGTTLDESHLDKLKRIGRAIVHVVELEPGDVDENEAAKILAGAVAGQGVSATTARTGRANLLADFAGVVRIDLDRLERLNRVPGVALATVRRDTPIRAGGVLASLKIIPYALDAAAMANAVQAVGGATELFSVAPFQPRRVGLVLSGSPGARERLLPGFVESLRPRITGLGASVETVRYVLCEQAEDEEAELAREIGDAVASGVDLLLLAGETAIVDRDDIAPRAMVKAGAEVVVYGAPVDPGNLVTLAYLGDLPIVGLPGCARSPKANVIDLVLPRLLVGERLDASDFARLGHGGLLEDVPERGLPRSWVV